jgi:hypothetical protein
VALAILRTAWNYEYNELMETLWVPRWEKQNHLDKKWRKFFKLSNLQRGWDWYVLAFTSRKHTKPTDMKCPLLEEKQGEDLDVICASPDGSHRLRPITIGKSWCPRVPKAVWIKISPPLFDHLYRHHLTLKLRCITLTSELSEWLLFVSTKLTKYNWN